MRRLAGTICIVLIPVALLMAFYAWSWSGYRTFAVPDGDEIVAYFAGAPTFSQWFKGTLGASVFDSVKVALEKWRNVRDLASFLDALWRSFGAFPALVYCLGVVFLYPAAIICWFIYALLRWLIDFGLDHVPGETSLQALRGFQGGSLSDVLRFLVI